MPESARDERPIPAGPGAAEQAARLARRQERLRARARARARLRAAGDAAPRLARAPEPPRAAAPALRAAPASAPPPPPRLSAAPSLRLPTLKAALGLALIAALAAGAGHLLGLPAPVLRGGGTSALSSSQGALISFGEGTALGLSRGPYFPVAGDVGYGEADATFGADRGGRRHEGQDVFAKRGTPVVSVRGGVVVDGGTVKSPFSGGRGNWVVVYSPLDGRSYVYLHLLEPPLVGVGDPVQAGQVLGKLGCTGSCVGAHLHFEVREGRAAPRAETKPIDPLPLLREWPRIAPSLEARQ